MPRAEPFHGRFAGVRELLQSPEMAAEMVRRAERAKIYAEGIAPVRSGEFASSFYVRASRQGGVHNDRACAWLGNDDPSAVSIELGTSDTPAHRTLRRAMLEAMGD
jgi:hypothetical protein